MEESEYAGYVQINQDASVLNDGEADRSRRPFWLDLEATSEIISTVVAACLADDVWASKLTAMLNHWYSKSTVTLGPDGDMNDVKAIGLVVFAAKNADFSLPQALVENLSALRISYDQLHPDMGLLPQDSLVRQ